MDGGGNSAFDQACQEMRLRVERFLDHLQPEVLDEVLDLASPPVSMKRLERLNRLLEDERRRRGLQG